MQRVTHKSDRRLVEGARLVDRSALRVLDSLPKAELEIFVFGGRMIIRRSVVFVYKSDRRSSSVRFEALRSPSIASVGVRPIPPKMSQGKSVADIYRGVVNDVIEGVKYAFLDDSVDEQVLQELRQLWESKLMQSKAVEPPDRKPTVMVAIPAPTTMQIKQQQSSQQLHQQQQHQQQQQPLTAQLLTAAPNVSAVQVPQQQPLNVQGPVLITPAQQLGNTSQTQTITIPPFQQHITSFQYLVPQGQPGPFVIQTAAGARIIQPQQGLPGAMLVAAPSNTTAPTGQNLTTKTVNQQVIQLDGLHDSSSDEEEEAEEEDEEQNDDNEELQGEEEDPLNSDDDVSDTDPTEVFDAENVVVCQFDKINRSKNKWKFHLKDGIMNLNGRDLVFQKSVGDAEW